MAKKSTSPWIYFGCGCVTLAVLIAVGFGALGFAGFRAAKNFEAGLKDPEVRAARSLETLGAESLPEGWHAYMQVKIPMVMEMVLVSNGEPPPEGAVPDDWNNDQLGDSAFVFINMRNLGDARADLERALEAGAEPANVDVGFNSNERIGSGTLEMAYGNVRWTSHRGSFNNQNRDGVYTMFVLDCEPADERVRMGFYWLAAEPESDLAGSPADETELDRFLGQFALCG